MLRPWIFCAAVSAVTVLAAQQANGPAAPDRFSGVYQNNKLKVELNRGGGDGYTGTFSFEGKSMPATGRAHGDALEGSFTLDDKTFSFTAIRTPSGLRLTSDGATYELKSEATPQAVSAATAPAGGKETGIVGDWRSPQGVVRIRADGTAVIGEYTYRYTIRRNILMMAGPDGFFAMPFELKGDELAVVLNGQQMRLTRVTQNSAAPASAAPAEARGGSPQELAGKWCRVTNLNATGGGARTSSACFVLYPNGTYEYSGESDNYGPLGGATSQTSDSGTWSATETTITANSRLRGGAVTYKLEKRNHPKNRDPMIVLDGEAYVTFYNKPPWR